MTLDMPKESIVFLSGVLISSILIPLLLPLFRKLGVVDRPNARSSHTSAIPRGMGVVVVFTFLVSILAYSAMALNVPLEEQGCLEASPVRALLACRFFRRHQGRLGAGQARVSSAAAREPDSTARDAAPALSGSTSLAGRSLHADLIVGGSTPSTYYLLRRTRDHSEHASMRSSRHPRNPPR
jgi:hypothetical protein